MAGAVWDLQRCTLCCRCGSIASTAGCSRLELSDMVGRRLRSGFPVGGLPKLALRKRRGGQLKAGAVMRALYSPLVESFGNAQRNLPSDLNLVNDRNDSGAWSTSSPTDAPTEHQEQAGEGVNEVEEEDGNIGPVPQDPITAAYGDGAHDEKLVDIGHGIGMKKGARGRARARAGPPSMSISQGFSAVGRRAVSHTVGAAGRPLNSSKVPGPIGFVMAFAVAVLGIKTAVEKQGLLPGTPQKICEKCDGYGVQQCHVCQGRGVLTWEGKLLHEDDPCPLCFGSCVKKCSSCGGVKIKKGPPPAMLEPQLNRK